MDSATDQHRPHARQGAASYRFGGFTLDSARGVLLQPDDAEIGLRPKTAELLRHLAERPGQVVSRDALMGAVWPNVIVTDDSITQCVAEIRRALGEAGPCLLRTLPRRGYLLAAEVAQGEALPPPALASPEAAAAPTPGHPGVGGGPRPQARPSRPALATGAGLVAAARTRAAGWWGLAEPPPRSAAPTSPVTEPPALPRMSVVVLPFANRGGDPEQDYLAEGITEDLTTILGRLPGSFVIGHSTAFTYKGRAVDVRQVGRDLGVRYAVEGSVRRLGERVGVDAQLLDTGTGAQLWAERLDEPRAGLPGLAQTVMLRIARAVDLRLLAAESSRLRAERPHDPDAADLVLRGRAIMNGFRSPERLAEARRLFERAVALDEGSAPAHGWLGLAIIDNVNFWWSEDREGGLRLAERHVLRALSMDGNLCTARLARGFLLQLQWRFEEALAEFDAVIAHNPSSPAAWGQCGRTCLLTDCPEKAMAPIEEAMRISPRDWNLGWFCIWLGFGSLMLGRDGDAVGYFLRARAANPNEPDHLFDLASAYALAGRTEDARIALDEFRRAEPEDTIAVWRLAGQRRTSHGLYLATKERQFDALRRLGMPEE